MAPAFNIGTGIGEVTDPAAGLPLQGMADRNQIATGVESPLYARAFVVSDPASSTAEGRLAIIVADIWSGTRRVKEAVLERLTASHPGLYTDENVMFAGTHTHSAPGGYSGTLLYDFDFSRGGCDDATVTCIAEGCARAVQMADANLAPGRIYVNRGEVSDCGRNRSEPAYLCNPQAERDHWGADTDREMLLLKFVKTGDGGQERPVGALNWYAIHPTDHGQKNTLISGDSKGYASALFEQAMGTDVSRQETFVAAFANANCGDVSGNVELGHIPDGIHDRAQMEKHGRAQFDVAQQLFVAATEEVTGRVDHRHTRVDLSTVTIGAGGARTWPAALGISFAAGSSEDSVPEPDLGIHEGITAQNIDEGDALITAVASLGLSAIFGISVVDQAEAVTEREGQLPKPVVLMPGLDSPPAVPHVVPVQLLRLGSVAVIGIPGELTTMAGRRLRTTVLNELSATGVAHVALGTYANEYAQYITTLEEYSSQQYEGASTLFGPHTLEAYQQVAAALASAMAHGTPTAPGPAPTAWSAPPQRRYRFRNRSSAEVKLQFYNTDDSLQLFTLPNGRKTIAAGAEVAYPEREFTGLLLPTIEKVTVWVGDETQPTMAAGQLLTIAPDGAISVGDYTPPARH
ncbi:MAG TPA: neutral/alkaline non-lysosomal ceramidase N-terminal domain-containing protein [Solirubrobacteraceae bacterium]|nr:neutral/alkaline non-lysosomal ceramidase N-terminal domain-containing protein [Solirubrobacteraceae bacterium]